MAAAAAAAESDSMFTAMLQSPSYSRHARYQGVATTSQEPSHHHYHKRNPLQHLHPVDKSKKDSRATHGAPSSTAAVPLSKSSRSTAAAVVATATGGTAAAMLPPPPPPPAPSLSSSTAAAMAVASPHVTIVSPQSGTVTMLSSIATAAATSTAGSSTGAAATTATMMMGSIGGIPANIHPEVGRLGLLYARHAIMGGNARCIAMLRAFQSVIRDYRTPSHTALNRHLDSHFKPLINYLVGCRPLSASMGNAIRHLKCEIANLPHDIAEDEAKEQLIEAIDSYIRDRIHLADRLIIQHATTKIHDQDVILIYAKSSVVLELLKAARAQGKKFRVIIVDSRPWLEGQSAAAVLSQAGIQVTYLLLNAIGYAIREATKIFLGAHCVYSNGTVLSRIGTCLVAMTGYDHQVPVIVCCETYKFSDRVQLESSCSNELGDPNMMRAPFNPCRHYATPLSTAPLSGLSANGSGKGGHRMAGPAGAIFNPTLAPACSASSASASASASACSSLPHLLNMMHDVSPSKYINMIITEIGMIPCTSVPVVLREYLSFNAT